MAERVYLRPGEIFITEDPVIVTTVLGSCVAVTMFSGLLGMSAMCHAMLPWSGADGRDSFRYVDTSIRYMAAKFREKGIAGSRIEVKLAGGADVLDTMSGTLPSVGQQNVQAALDLIGREGLVLAACNVGGLHGRKLHFHTLTGKMLMSRVKRLTAEGAR